METLLCLRDYLVLLAMKNVKNLDEQLKTSIVKHLQSMESEFQHYFPELKKQEATLGKNPYSNSLQVTDIPYEMQDQFCKLITDSSARSITYFMRKSHLLYHLNFGVMYRNHTHKYLNWLLKYCCPLQQNLPL